VSGNKSYLHGLYEQRDETLNLKQDLSIADIAQGPGRQVDGGAAH